jgi:F-type H+-transporting ATPase subunit delta
MATSRMVLRRYAQALLELASKAGAVERVQRDLSSLAAKIRADESLALKLESPRVTRAQKRELLATALGAGQRDLVRSTVLLLVDKGRAALVPELAEVFDEAAREAAGEARAQVTSAAPLEPALRDRLVERLSAASGRKITLEERVDAELLGGLRVVIGSRMFDGSVKRRLEELRARLLKAPLATTATTDSREA